jgi:hypothetical protein
VGGLTPVEDQTLAAVLMWVPMSRVYLVPAFVLTVRLLSPGWEEDRLANI